MEVNGLVHSDGPECYCAGVSLTEEELQRKWPRLAALVAAVRTHPKVEEWNRVTWTYCE
jgi:hypothetical protein